MLLLKVYRISGLSDCASPNLQPSLRDCLGSDQEYRTDQAKELEISPIRSTLIGNLQAEYFV